MKKLLTLFIPFIILSVFSITLNSQSYLDSLLATMGSQIKKEFWAVDNFTSGFNKVAVEAAKITNLENNVSTKFVRLSMTIVKGTTPYSSSAVLHAHEMPVILDFMKVLLVQINESPTASYTEVAYTTEGGTQIGAFARNGWSVFVKLDKYRDYSLASVKPNKIQDVYNALKAGYEKLKALD